MGAASVAVIGCSSLEHGGGEKFRQRQLMKQLLEKHNRMLHWVTSLVSACAASEAFGSATAGQLYARASVMRRATDTAGTAFRFTCSCRWQVSLLMSQTYQSRPCAASARIQIMRGWRWHFRQPRVLPSAMSVRRTTVPSQHSTTAFMQLLSPGNPVALHAPASGPGPNMHREGHQGSHCCETCEWPLAMPVCRTDTSSV
jgi:hypothetical protein